MSAADGRLKLALFGGVVVALVIARIALFSPSIQGLSPLSYEIVDDRGIPETSLFNNEKNSKIPVKVLARAVVAARTPRRATGPCTSTSKPALMSNLFTPFTASADECNPTDCTGHYNKTCVEHGQCEGLHLCCFDENNYDFGCIGVLNYCQNGGTLCGQSECDN
jgi:hypothetical protein